MTKRLLKALKGETLDRPPVWFMRQAGRYLPEYQSLRKAEPDFIKRCKNSDMACEITLQPLARYPELDAAIIFSDILTIPEAMPMGLRFENGIGPVFERPIRSAHDWQRYGANDVIGDLGYVGDALAKVKAQLPNDKALLGFSGSPWTLATYMVEGQLTKSFVHIKSMRYQDPQTLHTLLSDLSANIIAYGDMQRQAGADAFMLFDSWGGILSFDDYPLFSLQYLMDIISALKSKHPDMPIVLFTKYGAPWLEQMAHSGADGLGLDWTVDLATARQRVGADITLQGNLDPTLLLGQEEIIDEAVLKWCKHVGQQSRYILNLGHGLLPPTPPDNLSRLLATFSQYYQ